jgi:hypothetical protein
MLVRFLVLVEKPPVVVKEPVLDFLSEALLSPVTSARATGDLPRSVLVTTFELAVSTILPAVAAW